MRPVNLIPPDQRRGDQAPARAGAASYVLIAVLFAVLFAVTGYVLVSNDVKDKEAELAVLEAERVEAEARASALANFAQFQTMKDARVETVASLAESRFDWERVMREISLVIPETVWFTNITGTVAPDVKVQKAASVTARSSVTGPALTMIGCARSQQDVAALISALGDIDGVTRVLAERSEKPSGDVSDSQGGEGSGNDECRTRDFIAKFSIVAAFDGVTVASPSGSAPPAPEPAPEETTGTDADVTPEGTPEQQQAQDSAEESTERGRDAAGLVGAGDGG